MIRKILLALAALLGLVTLGLGGGIAYLQSDSEGLRSRLLGVVNAQLSVPVQATGLALDLFGRFPDVSLRLDDVFIEDPLRPNTGDTLLYFQEVYAQFGLYSLLRGETVLQRMTLSNGALNLRWNEDGSNNYSIVKVDSNETSTSMDLRGLTLLNTHIALSGYGETPWDFDFVAERVKLAGTLKEEALDATAIWELLIPKWNDQAVRLGGQCGIHRAGNLDRLEIDNGKMTLNQWSLALQGSIQDGMGQWEAKAEDLDMSDVMDLLPKALVPDPKTVAADGRLDLHIQASTTASGTRIRVDGDWREGKLNARNGWFVAQPITAQFLFDNGPQARLETAVLKVTNIRCSARGSQLAGDITVTNLISPEVRLGLQFDSPWMDWMHWLEWPTWEGSRGHLSGQMGWRNRFQSLEAFAEQGVWGGQWSGAITLDGANLQPKGALQPVLIQEASLQLLGQDIEIKQATLQTGKTKARVKGLVHNALSDDRYHYDLAISGQEWFVEDITGWEIWNADFTGAPEDSEAFDDTYDLQVAVDRMRYGAFSATDVSGRFSGRGLHVASDNVFLRHAGGTLAGRIEWVPLPHDEGQLLLDGRIQQVNLKSLMQSMDNFGQSQITDQNLSGILDATLRISAPFDAEMNAKIENLLATVDFTVQKGRITHFAPLQELSRFAEVEDLQDVRFGTVRNQLRIANQTVFIPEMTLENNALVLKAAGEHRFDNVMNFTLQMQLRDLVGGKKPQRSKDLDQFIAEEGNRGPVWIPIKLYGPMDDLKFSLDRKGLSQDIKSSVQGDWKQQGQDLRNLFQKPVERPVVPEKKYQFEWEEEPDTNRSFSQRVRSFSGL
ncbi:MAG TPA: hypothetical protein DCE13_05285 [Cryomorphaceae bacterium]|nr:MAG: hypothetical protein ABR98_01595 [Cryomorphaceae bacterium BACL7 MAG-120910-bin2]KRO83239.1 MAG: hypothetical protein ABR87_00600 [Cryomorphaceae bacterium BACL7 MAG-121220-bin83]HAB31941.1 hypothetical protein [Cryomorphaceae bacterium]